MSLSPDMLAKATPTRLLCRSGRWVLELTRLEAVDRDVFQPRLQRLEGADSILALLRRSDEGQLLASSAAQIMRSVRPDEDRAFDVNEGDWVQSTDAPAPTAEPSRREPSDLSLVLAELRAELVVLRASHARLRDRVMALEAAQSGLAPTHQRLPRGSRARRRSEPPAAPDAEAAAQLSERENPGFAATQASPGLMPPARAAAPVPAAAPPAAPVAATPAAAALPASFEELARAAVGEQLPPVLALPSLGSLRECLATLMEGGPALEAAAAPLELGSLKRPLACKLVDDEGKQRGAIVLDLTAALLLGAALLALPREEALRQVREEQPSEDALLAMSEICNNLAGPINAAPGNPHVRATALESVDVGSLGTPRRRLDLRVDGGSLLLAMF